METLIESFIASSTNSTDFDRVLKYKWLLNARETSNVNVYDAFQKIHYSDYKGATK